MPKKISELEPEWRELAYLTATHYNHYVFIEDHEKADKLLKILDIILENDDDPASADTRKDTPTQPGT